jgi:diacylglycerol kinase (ATP)
MKLLVYHNPNAGHGDVPKDVLIEQLQRSGHEVAWLEKNGDASLDAALAQPLDAVVVVGGDGSVGAVGRKLAGRPVPIGILPAGTANNIASSLGATPDNLIDLLASGRTTAFDVGWVEGLGKRRRFLEGVGLGAFAEAAALLAARGDDRSVEGRADELARDLRVLAEHVRRLEPCECALELDGREITGAFLMIEVTIGGLIGPNLRLSAGAVPSDGLLDVTLVEVAERSELLAFVTAGPGREAVSPTFGTIRAHRVRLQLPGGRDVHVDGETLRLDGLRDLRIGIEPAALRFFAVRTGRAGGASVP